MVLMHSLTVIPEVELVAVCDRNREGNARTKKLGEAFGMDITVYDDFDKFLEHDMDAVILCNYATEHATCAIKCLNSGRHVMAEVPAAENIAQLVELIEAVEKSGKVYAMAENYCYMDDTMEMRRRYKKGDIGELVYAEGAYIHDWSAVYGKGTRGRADHWMNNMYSTFYGTHAVNPIMYVTGLKPVSVSGFETWTGGHLPASLGYKGGGAGIQMITMENGSVVRAINGGLKREPWENNLNYIFYGTKGCMETHTRLDHDISVYMEGDRFCEGITETYYPDRFTAVDQAKEYLKTGYAMKELFSKGTIASEFHRCGDFYPGYFFAQAILGREEGQNIVDVYSAAACNLCNILAYRSILNKNQPMEIPDLRDPIVREKYRNDRACTSKKTAGDQWIPANPCGEQKFPQELYDYVREACTAEGPIEHGYGEDRAGHKAV